LLIVLISRVGSTTIKKGIHNELIFLRLTVEISVNVLGLSKH